MKEVKAVYKCMLMGLDPQLVLWYFFLQWSQMHILLVAPL